MAKKDVSQRFFTIQFIENGGEDIKTTKVPARKGKTLKEALEDILSSHDLSFQTHSIFLDTSKTPLPQNIDTFPFGGHTLHVRANEDVVVDERIKTLMNDETKKSQDVKKRYSDLLDHFEIYGFEGFEDEESEEMKEASDEVFLESSCSDVVSVPEEESRLKVQQQAIWELFSTEVSYLGDLRIVIEVFKKCLQNLQREGYLMEVNIYSIFANIDEIYRVNLAFWNCLKEALVDARLTKEPIKPHQLLEAFDEFEELFQPYIEFCNEDISNKKYLIYSETTNALIKQYINWCDNHEKCMRLKLAGFLIKPLQRVTKYSLLLRAILSKTDDEEEKFLLEDMMSRVETFVSKINSAVHLRQEQEKLLSVLAKFDCYSPVKPINDATEKITLEYCNLDLKARIPGLGEDHKRFFLKDGPMKCIDKQGKKDIHVFLFTDLLVLTRLKKNSDKYQIIRQPFRLNKVVLRDLEDPGHVLFIYLNEYAVVATSFVMQVSQVEQEKWKSAILEAKAKYENLRIEYETKQDLIFDEDTIDSVMVKSRARRRLIKEKSKSTSSLSSLDKTKVEMPFEWKNKGIIIAVTAFCVLNVLIAKLFGYN